METYNVGSGAQQITLAVDISTFGLAATRAVVTLSTGAKSSAAHSVNATGDIATQAIGSANSLENSTLKIITKVDILGDDQNEREKQYNDIKQVYTLGGGTDDSKVYTETDVKQSSDDFSVAFLFKTIQLI